MSSCSVHCKRRPSLPLLFWSALLLCGLGLGATRSWSAGEAAGNLVFILDASGSMGAQVQGRMKMEVAKEVLTNLITDLPAGVRVGLVAYGHREKDDCNDVETLAALAPVDKPAVIEQIRVLDHKGKTPITESVRQVAEGLRSQEGETTIVLVSDGEETCGGDPCALVKELKAAGIQFVMHVIGFAVTDQEKVQLDCMAQAGGGTYLAAKNAGELSLAARKVVAKTEQSFGRLKLRATRNGKPVGAWYEVLATGADQTEGPEPLAANPLGEEGETVKLVPGVYDVRIKNMDEVGNPVLRFTDVAVVLGQTVERVADFSGGSLKVRALRNGKPFNAWFEVFQSGAADAEEGAAVAANPLGEEGETIKLAPGVYDLTIKDQDDAGSPVVRFTAIRIEAGKTVAKVAEFAGGSLRLKALKNGQPVGAWYRVFPARTAPDAEEGEPLAANPIGDQGETVKLPPGRYDLRITFSDESGESSVDFPGIRIEAGKVVEQVGEF